MNSIVAFFVTFGVMNATHHTEAPKAPTPTAQVAVAAQDAHKVQTERMLRQAHNRERIELTNAWLKEMRKPYLKPAIVVANR